MALRRKEQSDKSYLKYTIIDSFYLTKQEEGSHEVIRSGKTS